MDMNSVSPVTISPADLAVVQNFVSLSQVLSKVLTVAAARPATKRPAYTGPDRRHHSNGVGSHQVSNHMAPLVVRQVVPKAPSRRRSLLYAYWPTDARKRPSGLTAAQQDVYNACLEGGHQSVETIARKAAHPTETTRVALNRLWRARVLRRAMEEV